MMKLDSYEGCIYYLDRAASNIKKSPSKDVIDSISDGYEQLEGTELESNNVTRAHIESAISNIKNGESDRARYHIESAVSNINDEYKREINSIENKL
jgi:hypothetical protein